MNIKEFTIGSRVLIQSDANTREIAEVTTTTEDGMVLVKLTNGKIIPIHPQYVIKSF